MAIGIYQALKRRAEGSSTAPTVFGNNVQIWLSIFAFSTFIVSFLWSSVESLWPALRGWLLALVGLSSIGAGIIVVLVGCFFALAVYSFVQLIKMGLRAWRGIPYKFNPNNKKETPNNVLKAIRPVVATKNLREYNDVVDRLIETNKKLIKENDELIAEYQQAIHNMEIRSDESKP